MHERFITRMEKEKAMHERFITRMEKELEKVRASCEVIMQAAGGRPRKCKKEVMDRRVGRTEQDQPGGRRAADIEPSAEVIEPSVEVIEPSVEVIEPSAEVIEPSAEVISRRGDPQTLHHPAGRAPGNPAPTPRPEFAASIQKIIFNQM